MAKYLTLFFCAIYSIAIAQAPNKQKLDHSDFDVWKTISNARISNDGQWVTYALTVERGDPTFFIHHIDSGEAFSFERGTDGRISADSRHVIFQVSTAVDTIRALKRRDVKTKDMPLDTLVIFDLQSRQSERIPAVKSFGISEDWGQWLVYKESIEPATEAAVDTTASGGRESANEKKDSTAKKTKAKPKEFLVIKHLTSDFEQKIPAGKLYTFAEDSPKILISSESKDSTFDPGVYLFDAASKGLQAIHQEKGDYKYLSFDKAGEQVAFLADLDTTDSKIRPFELFFWTTQQKEASKIAAIDHLGIDTTWLVSENERLRFSENGSRLFFGVAPPPLLPDTSLLDEDKVNVEVWSWNDERLYTQQEVQKKSDQEYGYDVVWNISANKFWLLNDQEIRDIRYNPDRNARYALGAARESYYKAASWEGYPEYRDIYQIDLETGSKEKIANRIKATPRISPAGKYFYWFNAIDTAWQVYSIENKQIRTITNNRTVPFFDELNDRPMLPNSYGIMGWTKDDAKILIYDRFDIWLADPLSAEEPRRLTDGRKNQLSYRFIQTDPEADFINPDKEWLLYLFDEKTKRSGYASMRLDTKPKQIILEDYQYDRRPNKAKNTERYLYTKESFQRFPDLLVGDRSFRNAKSISDANPQQEKYSWGSIELYEWTSADGQSLQGLLVKPEGFDPNKKYPMIVNFYERSSNRLHRHNAPYPGRSTINYSFYASRGYLIFNPDVPYTVGYPGESAEKAVISGTLALIDEGFVDKKRIGVQGHSWGGYQIAHLITRTNIFRCAESGAPVVNMFSAYGGIRWGSGLSRMFQYENTQSRIGGTIWEYPTRYIENSPIFFLDKVETPVLILHNDEDGAVPWYQGIEFFVGLRRLGKPAWLLNYNGEPHWPVKRQNRLDFNIRMQQFFDYYLMDAPLPLWMERGVPALEKGINQGLELKE
jgi:hypothetical protein